MTTSGTIFKFSIVLALLTTALSLSAQRRWTLEECISYAKANNITLQQQRLQLLSAEEDVRAQRGAMLPTLSASTNHSIGYRPWQDNGVATVTNGQVNSKVDKTYYNGSYGINAQWTVWNGGRNINNVRLNQLTAQQAEMSVEQQANSIEERICQLYVQCLYLREAIGVCQESLTTSRKNEERGTEMVQVGLLSRADLAQLTAQRATDEYNVVEAQGQLATYMLQLRQLLELTADDDFDIVEASAYSNDPSLVEVPALNTVYERAIQNRPEIRSARLGIESAGINLRIARAGWLPTLSLTGGLSSSTNSLATNGWGTQMKTNFNMTGGLQLSIPIFDGWQTRTNVNKARIRQDQAALELADQQKQLYQTIEGYWQDATTNRQRYIAACATAQSAAENYELLEEQFNLGLKNIVELMTGKDNLMQARQNQLQSKYLAMLNMEMLNFYARE
jgi:outer membrane protein